MMALQKKVSNLSHFSQGIDPRAPVLTSSAGLRFRGSRLTLAATYRLASSLSTADRETAIGMAGLLDNATSEEAGRIANHPVNDFEPAARNCLAALYIKLMLERPTFVAWPYRPTKPHDGEEDSSRAVRLRLGHVRAVSANEAEYYLKPTLFCVPRRDGVGPAECEQPEPMFHLREIDPEGSTSWAIWAAPKGSEDQMANLEPVEMPKTRKGLVAAISTRLGGALGALEAGLLGLDEWRFQEDLRIAFAMFGSGPGNARMSAATSPLR